MEIGHKPQAVAMAHTSETGLPPGFTWPGGARLAVAVTFDYQGEVGLPSPSATRPNLKQVQEHIYEPRVGIWRILDVLRDAEVVATFPTCGRTVELYPESCMAILERGHELAAHGYDHEKLSEFSLEGEKAIIERTLGAFDQVLSHRPSGWRSPYYITAPETPETLISTGFSWQSDFHDDDLPYILHTKAGTIVEIPPQIDDWPRYWSDVEASAPAVRGNPRDILSVLIDAFDVLFREAQDSSKLLCVTLHPQIVGRPDRIVILRDFLLHIQEHAGLWIASCSDICDHVLALLGDSIEAMTIESGEGL
jgi:peptidoglycan/xylan/chitin deacetylase (PgdA/CDA1 family)